MTLLKPLLFLTWASALAAVWGLQHGQSQRDREIGRLREENARLQAAIAANAAAMRTMAEPASASVGEGVPRSPAPTRSAEAERSATSARAAAHWPTRRYYNAGQTTPVATLQTMAWACDQGDVATMAALFFIDAPARAQVDAIYASVSAKVRAEWTSAEALAAGIMVRDGIDEPYPGMEVLALAQAKPAGEGRVTLLLPGCNVSGLVFQQTPEGWKYVITEAVVADYVSRRLMSKSP